MHQQLSRAPIRNAIGAGRDEGEDKDADKNDARKGDYAEGLLQGESWLAARLSL